MMFDWLRRVFASEESEKVDDEVAIQPTRVNVTSYEVSTDKPVDPQLHRFADLSGEARRRAFVHPISSALPEQNATYIIYTDSSTIYAINGHTGEVDYSGSDAGTVIQNTIDAVETLGGHIHIKGGTYTIAAKLSIEGDILFTGDGMTFTTLALGDAVNDKLIEVLSGTCSFVDLGFDGNKAGQSVTNTACIRTYADNNQFIRCKIVNANNTALVFNGVDGGLAMGCIITDPRTEGIGAGNTNIKIVDNFIKDCGTEGVLSSNLGSTDPSTLLIQGNSIEGCTNYGIKLSNGVTQGIVANNHVKDCGIGIGSIGSTGAQDNTNIQIIGNYVEDCTVALIYISRTLHYTILGNYGKDSEGRGIYILGSYYGDIADNYITSVSSIGVQLTTATGGFECLYTDIHDNTIDGGTYGVQEGGAGNFNRIHHNTLLNAATLPVNIAGANTKVDSNVGYVTEKRGTAIMLSGTSSILVNLSGLIVNRQGSPTSVLVTVNTSGYGNLPYYAAGFSSGSFTIYTPSNTSANVTLAYDARYIPS